MLRGAGGRASYSRRERHNPLSTVAVKSNSLVSYLREGENFNHVGNIHDSNMPVEAIIEPNIGLP
jgi:hypothetical protein